MMPDVSLAELLEGLQHYRQRAERAEAENTALRAERDRLVAEVQRLEAQILQAPIPLNTEQEQAAKLWAADDRLWTTQETVEFNLRTFARATIAALLRRTPE